MAEDTDLISRADSLIKAEAGPAGNNRRDSSHGLRRRRSFIASSAQKSAPDGAALPAPGTSDDEDLPILTDVVLPAEALPEANVASSEPSQRLDLAAEVADIMDRQLRSELPALVEAAFLNAADQLQQGITVTVEAALRDFLGQRGQLRLPLENPDSSEQNTPAQAQGSEPEQRRDPV